MMKEKEKEKGEEEVEMMKPWEQHGSVLNMPRYNYNAASTISSRPCQGFLITCTFDWEKSATKEAMQILQQYLDGPVENDPKVSPALTNRTINESQCNTPQKRPRVDDGKDKGSTECGSISLPVHETQVDTELVHKTQVDTSDLNNGHKQSGEVQTTVGSVEDAESGDISRLCLMKMARKGILFISLPDGSSVDTVEIVSKIIQDIETGVRKPPVWCQRILPVQETCLLLKESLTKVVSKLVKQFTRSACLAPETVLKYAVGYNRRGVDDCKNKDNIDSTCNHELLGRTDCIEVVAGAVQGAFANVVVNLTAPEMVVMVDILPLTMPQENVVCAVSVLPKDLVNAKPKLSVKSVIPASHISSKKRKAN